MSKIVFGIGEVFKNICRINLSVLVQQNINNKKLWGLFCFLIKYTWKKLFFKKVNNCMRK